MLRNIPSSFDPGGVRRIDDELGRLAAEHGVAIPWAVESGSRAWGFPSPDSDCDCRFVLVRAPDRYLSPWPDPDVDEVPLDGVLDLNGWDRRKAVRLVVDGNPTAAEWLRSPMVYSGDAAFRDRFLEFAEQVSDWGRIAGHSLHVGRKHWERAVEGGGAEVRLKTAMYGLRCALSPRWLRLRPSRGVPPMNLRQLVTECDLTADLAEAVQALVEVKAVAREMGSGLLPTGVRELVTTELDEGGTSTRSAPRSLTGVWGHAADFFCEAVSQFGPH